MQGGRVGIEDNGQVEWKDVYRGCSAKGSFTLWYGTIEAQLALISAMYGYFNILRPFHRYTPAPQAQDASAQHRR